MRRQGAAAAAVVAVALIGALLAGVGPARGDAGKRGAIGRDGCGQVCQCHYIDDNLSVHCVKLHLVRIPPDLPANVTILDLSMNNITLLTPATFEETPFPLLRRLDLRMNGLADIRPGAWRGLGHLGELGLDHNELLTLRAGMFADLTALSVLSVNNNKIASIENATFDGLVLKHLNLHDNNPLQAFDTGLFQGARVESLSLDRCALVSVHVDTFMPLANSLKNLFWSHNLRPLHLPMRLFQGLDLATLWLSDNQITDVHFLLHTNALHLDLSSNPLGELDLGAYPAMEHVEFFNISQTQLKGVVISGGRILFNLQELDISENFLRTIDGTLFQRMPSLTRLDVSGNQLHYIGASLHLILYQLEYWDLTGNQLLCDCRLEWFRRWAGSQNKTHLRGAVCGLPRLTPVIGAPEFTCTLPTILRISSDAVESTWHLQCDAEGWPTPRVTWGYNMSRHQAVDIVQRWISFHGHPYRNSSVLAITARGRLPPEFCFHFVCTAYNSEGHDRTEYVHCAESPQPSPPGGGAVAAWLWPWQQQQRRRPAAAGTGGAAAQFAEQNSSVIAARHSGDRGNYYSPGAPPPPPPLPPALPGAGRLDSGFSVSVGLSAAALVSLVLLGLLAIGVYSRRHGDRLLPRAGWEQPDESPGEGLTDSTKCLVEHNEGADKATFSIDTV